MKINVNGVRAKNGTSEVEIFILMPQKSTDGFSCRTVISGIFDQEIFAESPLSALHNAIMVLDTMINPPSPLFMSVALVEEDSIPELSIEFSTA